MTTLNLTFAAPTPVALTDNGSALTLTFPAPQAVTLSAVGMQGPGGGSGGGVTDGDKGGILVTLSGTDWRVKPGSITDLMLGTSAIALFAAASHTHTIANVTGLQAALDGKAATTHTHVAADVTDFASAARGTVLTGYAAAGARTALAATDTILGAFGKLGKWIADLAAIAFSGSASDLTAGTLPAARFDDTAHGARSGGTLHSAATGAAAGFMSAADKTKLDGVAAGANNYVHPNHTGDATSAGDGAITLATVNSNVGTFGLAGSVAQFVVNAKGLITSAVNVAISITSNAISDSTAAGRAMLTALTATAQTALLDTFTSVAKGLAPASGGGTTNFLRADGTWAAPPGGGSGSPGGSTTQVQYNNAGAFAGAANVLIEGSELRLPVIATPTTPAASGVKVYSQTKTGRRDGPAMLFPSGREAMIQEDLAEFRTYRFQPASNASANLGDGTLPLTITGSATAGVAQAADLFTLWPRVEARVNVAATTAVAGYRGAGNFVRVGNDASAPGGFYFRGVWGPSTGIATATHRAMCGLTTNTAAMTDVEPSTLVDGIWMGWDAADTNIQIMHNDATGVATKIDLGASFPVPTVQGPIYQIELFSPNSSTQSVNYRIVRYNTTARTVAAEATGTITANLPAVTTLLSPRVYCSVGGTSSVVGVALYGMLIQLDY